MADHFTGTHTPSNTPTPTVAQTLANVATLLLAAPDQPLGPLTITRAVITAAGPAATLTSLTPIWDALPLGSHGDHGHTHHTYAAALLATDSDPDMDEAPRRARAPRTAVTA
ncbi:hypothetical protein [Streptomyces sp. CS014]|uniref:hypothetical protein n=1 Tax=Streptomyces sp. CS014 TaxID=2162707 RepID=UPI0013A53870|nr:hypothetical protein [Streptomyces sp. CS014]